jgi:hypothetical protein
MTENKVQQNSTDLVKAFEPTPHMLKWLETAIELGHTASITDISKESKVDRTNWYLWIRNQKFVEWWDSQWQKYLKVNRWKLDAIGMREAEKDHQYWKEMMERTGNIEKEQNLGFAQQINIGGKSNIEFVEDDK